MKRGKNHSDCIKEHRSNIHLLALIVLAVLLTVLLVLYVRNYKQTFRTTLNEETYTYLSEIAQQVSLVMNERIAQNMHSLETDALALSAMQDKTKSRIQAFLKTEAERNGYSRLAFSERDGFAFSEDGQEFRVSGRDHIKNAFQGINAVSDIIISPYSGEDQIEFAVPVFSGTKIAGALVATYTLQKFEEILQVNTFEQSGSTRLIDSYGTVFLDPGAGTSDNFFYTLENGEAKEGYSFDKFHEDISDRKPGILHYTMDKIKQILYYQPLGIKDWFVLVSVPADIVTEKTDMAVEGMFYTGTAMALLVACIMLLFILLQLRSQKTLKTMLNTDPVTGGFSRYRFDKEAVRLVEARRKGHYVFVHINIQKFKMINTTFGQTAGDNTLSYIYRSICDKLEADELAARSSADLFSLLMRYGSKEETNARIFELFSYINRFNDGLRSKYMLHFGAGACLVEESPPDMQLLFEHANLARTNGIPEIGRLSYLAFYNDYVINTVLRETEIENHMHSALDNGEFEVFLQPKYELVHYNIAGAEALIRWRDPERGLIFPSEFIPLFERNGFIVKLDLFVFEQVCQLIQTWVETGFSPVSVSVNLSRIHLSDPEFLQQYRQIYKKYGFPAHLMEIEITESMVFDNVEMLCRVIQELHEIGFRCSLDDFGSGYSSLNMLKNIPVDALKLDKAFFDNNGQDVDRSRYVIENVINLAKKLKMETISEGVEAMEQVEFLQSAGCDLVQGYVFAKPMMVSDFEEQFFRKC